MDKARIEQLSTLFEQAVSSFLTSVFRAGLHSRAKTMATGLLPLAQ